MVPLPSLTGGDFTAIVFDGSLIAPRTGRYHLWLGSDDGSRLWLDGQLVLDNGGLHAFTYVDKILTLGAGWHELRLEYFQWGNTAALSLEWEGPATFGRQTIPTDNLSPNLI